MKRLVLVAVAILTMALVPHFAAAQVSLPNLIGPGIPGSSQVTSPGWIFGGSGSFGEQLERSLGTPTFYIGYLTDRAGTRFGFDAESVGLGGVTAITHKYEKAGIALGVEVPFVLKSNFAFLPSAWYVAPIMKKDEETYFAGGAPAFGREWDTANTWWWAQGAVAYAIGNTAVLGGFRYDYYDTKFDSPEGFFGVPPSDSDQEADVTANNFVPFFGVQYTYDVAPTNLFVRMVGFPFLLGTADYRQTIGLTGASSRLEGSGNYDGGYFFEAQVDYSRRMFGKGQMGVFGRFSMVHGTATIDVDGDGAPLFAAGGETDTFDFNLNRTAWTIGGKFSVDFHLPFAL